MVRLNRDPLIQVDNNGTYGHSTIEQYGSDDLSHKMMQAPPHNGILQLIWLPMLCQSGSSEISLSSDFFYGFTLWSGVALIITSATGIRVTTTKRRSTVNRYLFMQLLTDIVYCFAISFAIKAFAAGLLNDLGSCMTAGHVLGATFIAISGCLHFSTFFFNASTIFKDKPLELFKYVSIAFLAHCCPQTSMGVQDDA